MAETGVDSLYSLLVWIPKMFRLFVMAGFLMMIGWVILSAFSPDLAGDLVIYVFALLAGAAVLKVSIDFAMHYRKKGVERDARNRVRPNETAEVYTNMEEFQRATSRLQQNNK